MDQNTQTALQEKLLQANRLFQDTDYTAALALYEQLAKEGLAHVWYDVGFQYEQGMGIPQDLKKAGDAYRQGAEAGDRTCQTRLGKLLLWGKALPKEESEAYSWFCEAAEQGDEIAKMWKGHCLLYGLGVKTHQGDGSRLLYDALNYNYPSSGESQAMQEESQFDWDEDMLQLFWDLGDAHENGLGVPKRQHLAGYYFDMVADSGWEKALEKMTHYKQGGLFKRWKRIK